MFPAIVHRKFKMRLSCRTGFVRAGREFWRKIENQSHNHQIAKSSQSPLRKQGQQRAGDGRSAVPGYLNQSSPSITIHMVFLLLFKSFIVCSSFRNSTDPYLSFIVLQRLSIAFLALPSLSLYTPRNL